VKTALLDTNVLLALAWPNHQHHIQAHQWFAAQGEKAWATCALTQLGFVRLSSNPVYTASSVSPQNAAELLRRWTRFRGHHFWASPEADKPAIYAQCIGHQQVNDAWLVEVARRNSGRLFTFDTRLPVHSTTAGLVEVIET
jgi:toxin-antitoxin system PIN domain toxin